MGFAEKICQRIQEMPESVQAEVLDFVEFIDLKERGACEHAWSEFSLSAAMRGMEDEAAVYTESDLKEKFQ